jgi:predicted transcriptional regulator
MTDYSWLEPMERRTREIREETQRIKDETEKMKQETHNLPVPDDAPWLNLSQEEVNELRNKKFELTQYGKQKIKELTVGQLMDTEKFQEEFAKSQVFDADKFVDEERKQRSDTVLARYNRFYNDEVSGMPHGMVLSMEHLQCITLECMVDALICENMNVEYNAIAIDDIKDLIEGLYRQSNEFLERVRTVQEQAQGLPKVPPDAL